ncbi:uncharacterized protein OGAPODRAFT_16417 [Ogataea polymorpha]|uniref:uncharacterized protein n=1 Tax=Ogataea polymorpha TaxID=460523 RepID=UPI0007F43ECD|nr:uncharacterized protein OGAPODRAFT_16417 [Ogataea polymorpha]KAG7931685.1 hypothetical protein KL934_004097 [Ogataea polymorpha]OBA15451.1 hypothetical protein OGAPODRAFT_16417 [Ogataea polymorpha]
MFGERTILGSRSWAFFLRKCGEAGNRRFSTSGFRFQDVEIKVDGVSVKIEAGSSIIQAADKAGIMIPRYCYHDKLAIAGNCRMCLVEIEKSPKMAAACAMPVMNGVSVLTNSEKVKKAREGITEFLLYNHPLDCPVCDQGGECDLQEQTLRYGSDRGRFHEVSGKRAVENKALGPLIKTSMNRCIHCTRCVRFLNDVAGAPEMGSTGRGNDLQIGTYVERNVNSEMSGNVIDLCPVGALTSKPYAFKARPWELKRTETIDVTDALGSAIRVDSRGSEIMRVLPRLNDEINEEWISDKTRFSYDGLSVQRLTKPMIKVDHMFADATWHDVLSLIKEKYEQLKPAENEVKGIAGALADVESMVALKDLINRMNSENLSLDVPITNIPSIDFRSNYLFNSTIERIDECDQLLLIGTNPRHEAPCLNAKLRNRWLNSNMEASLIGEEFDSTFEYEYFGSSANDLVNALKGKLGDKLANAQNPMVIVGSGVLENRDSLAIQKILSLFAAGKPNFNNDDWKAINLLHREAARTGALDIGFYTESPKVKSANSKIVFLLGADEVDPTTIPKDSFVIYIGSHGDVGASLADVILPGAAFTEKSATYVNTEGRAQLTRAALGPPGSARQDWQIIKAISEYVGLGLPYEHEMQLRSRMLNIAPHLVNYDVVEPTSTELYTLSLNNAATVKVGAIKGDTLKNPIENFYFTDVISRNSKTMAQCVGSFGPKIEKIQDENAHLYLGIT